MDFLVGGEISFRALNLHLLEKEMDAELKRKWVEALRSGKYKQGKSVLRSKETGCYCCLGVLCDVSGVGKWGEGSDRECWRYVSNGWEGHFYTPDDPEHPLYLGRPSWELVTLNDQKGMTFNEIADWIETNL